MKKMRIMVLALMVMAMAAGLLSGPAAAHAEGSTPEIVLGAGEIAKATSTARNYTVWFGRYNDSDWGNGPVQWRVLSGGGSADPDDGTNLPVSGTGEALLISKQVLDVDCRFKEDCSSNQWAVSDAKAWCMAFWNSSNWLTAAEKRAVNATTVNEQNNSSGWFYRCGYKNEYYSAAPLNGEHIFFLSAREADKLFTGDSDRQAQEASVNQSWWWWWLRSPLTSNVIFSGYVHPDGYVYYSRVDFENGARPAFNLNLSSVLFSSLISNQYKLTLADSNRTIGIQPGAAITRDSATQITVPYQIDSGSNHVSLLITNKDDAWTAGSGWSTGAVKQYYATAAVSEANGTVTFTLPDNYETNKGNWQVWLLAEQVNGEHETDYASAPVAITVPHWHDFTYTASGAAITATCTADCPNEYDTNGITLTLKAPTNLKYDGNAKTVTIDGYPATAPAGLAAKPTTVSYYKSTGVGSITVAGDEALSGAPSGCGNYVARMTWGGETANLAFSITSDAITFKVTFKIVNGGWDDTGSSHPIEVILSRAENEDKLLKLEAGDIPPAGTKPAAGYMAGGWSDPAPSTELVISEDKEYTYTYAAKGRENLSVTQAGAVYGSALEAPAYAKPAGTTKAPVITYTGTAWDGTAYGPLAEKPVQVGSYTVSVTEETADTIYTGTADFAITPRSITGATVTLSASQLQFNGSEQSVTVASVTLDGTALAGTDYTVSGDTKGTGKGTYTVTVTGKGNYKDAATAAWEIVEKPMTVSAPDVSASYDGNAHGIAVSVTDPASGYTVKYGTAAGPYDLDASPTLTNAGKLVVGYQITADNYTPVTGSATVTVAPKAATVTALEQTVKEGESIQTGTQWATLTDALSGHTLSAVTLTAENGKIVPSAAKILDARGNDVTGNYAVTYTPATLTTLGKISRTVTFKVVNGSWDDGSAETKTVTLTGFAGDTLKLAAADIPAVGAKPGDNFKAGAWDVTPSADAEITADKTYTYTYALRDAYLVTVTNDGNGAGSASPNTGYEGTEVTLTAYPAAGYKFKEWQVVSGGVSIADNKFNIGKANVEVKAVFEAQATGWHKGEAQIQPGAPVIQCSNMQEVVESIIAAIQKDEMKGISEEVRQAVLQPDAQVLVLFISAPLSMDQIPSEDRAALQKLQEEAGYTGIVPFDITLMLNVNGQDVAEVHETKIPVKFSVGIMENLLDKTRQFALANVHNGAAKVLPTTRRGNFLDGESTEFSTYAIAYKDEETPTDTPAPTSTPAPVIDPAKFDDVAVPSDSFSFKKVWQGDSEKSIDFTLYRQGGTVYHHGFDKKVVSNKEWQYDAWFSAPAACYVIEKPIPGYQTKYVNVGVYEHITDRCCDGGTIINKKIPKTGDEEPLLLWAGMILLGTLGLTATLVIGKKRKANQ